MDPVVEIKNKLNIVELISEYVKLNKTGTNWKGLCPFHGEKSPSFMVNEERQFYYCFGCNEGGDIFSFLQKLEGIDFPEALKLLAQKAGVTLKQQDRRAISQKTRLYDLLEKATLFWQQKLKSEVGKETLTYLEARHLNQQTIDEFRLGFSPDSWDETMKYLLSQGFTETELLQSGMTLRKKTGSGSYDRFRNRVIFPVQDIHGNVVGYSARAMSDDQGAKYINTPESTIYHKGSVLYGLDKAKQAIKELGYVIVVEGNMDVVTSHQAGVKNVVAVSGTALTDQQIGLLKRFTKNIAFCFDMDDAGQRAAVRSIDMAMLHGMNIKVIQLPSGKDPDESINHDPKEWLQAIKGAKLIMEYHFAQAFARYDLADVNQKTKCIDELLLEINKIPNNVEQDHWIKQLSDKTGAREDALRERLKAVVDNLVNKKMIVPEKNTSNFEPIDQPKTKKQILQDRLISLLFNYPSFLKVAINDLPVESVDNFYQSMYKQLIIWYNQNNQIDKENLAHLLKGQTDLDYKEDQLERWYLILSHDYIDCSVDFLRKELVTLIQSIKALYFEKKKKLLEEQLTQFEKSGNTSKVNEVMHDLQRLYQQKS